MTDFIRTSVLRQLKKTTSMELAKVSAIFTGSVNILLWFGAWFSNLDNTKSSILFLMAVIMTSYRFYRWALSDVHKKKMEALSRREKELELMERENNMIRKVRVNNNGEIL